MVDIEYQIIKKVLIFSS